MVGRKERVQLRVSRQKAASDLAKIILRGQGILAPDYNSVTTLEREEPKWSGFVKEMLERMFTTDELASEFSNTAKYIVGIPGRSDMGLYARRRMEQRVAKLESIQQRLQLIPEAIPTQTQEQASDEVVWKLCMHHAVRERCYRLYRDGHYADAVEKSLKVVKDRLRKLTGFEKGADAFGRAQLYVNGAIAPHVEADFNEGVKFLTMAIDKFRNEKSHTSEGNITEPTKALQYLVLSSLAMRFLDDAEIRK